MERKYHVAIVVLEIWIIENYSLTDVVLIYSQKRLFQRLYDHDVKET